MGLKRMLLMQVSALQSWTKTVFRDSIFILIRSQNNGSKRCLRMLVRSRVSLPPSSTLGKCRWPQAPGMPLLWSICSRRVGRYVSIVRSAKSHTSPGLAFTSMRSLVR